MKKLVLLFLFVCCFGSMSSQVRTYYFTDGELFGGFFGAISDNGKYIVGTQPNTYSALLFVKETEELIRILSPEEGGDAAAQDVSDDGVIVGLFTDPAALSSDGLNTPCEVPGLYNYKEDKWTALFRPDGVFLYPGSFSGSATSISADGNLIGGYLPTARKKFVYNGVIWNGDGSLRSILPDPQSGAGAKNSYMSNDGTVACGWSEDAMYGKVTVWKDGELLSIGKGGHGTVVSANGHFVGGNYMNGVHRMGAPFIWSEEAGIMPVGHPDNIFSGEVSGISDDGRVAVGHVDYSSMTDHHPFIIINGVYHDFDDYMFTNYGIKGPMNESFFTISAMSADGSVLSGFSFIDGSRVPWILAFDQPLSIEKTIEEIFVSVYPNPVSEVLNIAGEYSSATLYDYMGNCLLHDTHMSGKMNVSTLEEGIYFVTVAKDDTSHTFKVAVNH